MTGFNPTIVAESISKVEAAYNDLMNALYQKTQTEFVNEMGESWACQNAVNYFNNIFKPGIDQLLNEAHYNFSVTVNVMNAEAARWAQAVDYGWSNISFGGERKEIDVTSVKENINDERGIIEANANEALGKLPGIVNASEEALEAAKVAVENCGFLDPSEAQVQSLVQALSALKASTAQVITDATNSANREIAATIEEYGTLAKQNADTSSNMASGI